MPTVNGQIRAPDGSRAVTREVTFSLVDAAGQPVNEAYDGDDTLVGPVRQALDAAGDYSIVLPGNADITPSGTRWLRTLVPPSYATAGAVTVRSPLIVPTAGGPYFEEALLAAPLSPLPVPEPLNELDVVELTADFGPVTAANGVNLVPVPGTVVEVPDVDQPVWVEAQTVLQLNPTADPGWTVPLPSTGGIATAAVALASSAEISVSAAKSFMPITVAKVGGTGSGGTGRSDCSAFAKARVAPRSPGEYQMFITANNAIPGGFGLPGRVSVKMIAGAHVPTRMTVLGI